MFKSLFFLTFCVFLCAGASPQSRDVIGSDLKCNRPHEKLGCLKPCPPERSCRNRLIQYRCKEDFEETPCTPSCVCEKGFFRNAIGDCITKEQCEMCDGPNEYYSCGAACDNVCSELQTQNKTNCPIVNIVCNKKCYCDDGYARNAENICIAIPECSNTNTSELRVRRATYKGISCLANEVYTPCKRTCPPDTCISLVAKFKCDSKEVCKPGCHCNDGYLRAKDGAGCMPLNHCPQLLNAA